MFISIPNIMKSLVTDVSPGHWRVQAIVIESSNTKTLLINSYFQTDKRQVEHKTNDNGEDLIETIVVIRNVIRDNECDTVFWA